MTTQASGDHPTGVHTAELADLIGRLARAQKASRILDIEICASVSDYSRSVYHRWCGLQPRGSTSATVKDFLRDRISTRYTSSVDDALRLVPRGCEVAINIWRDGTAKASVWNFQDAASEHHGASAITPAIALCIAALKARSAS